MASNIQPTGLDWKNLPQKTTPISAENLNKMANTIDDLVEAVNPLNTVEANPEGTPTEGLEKVEIDGTLYEVKGGHKILNDSGSTLTQKDNLQFKGVYTQNNGDNTEVNICRTMTKAQMEALSGEELKGFINTSDEPNGLPLTTDWIETDNGDSLTDRITDIEDGIYDATYPIISSSETEIGKWIDGKTLYRKVIDLGSLPNATSKSVAHNITNPATFVKISGATVSGGNRLPLPHVDTSGLQYCISLYANATDVIVVTGSNRSNVTGFAILEYTKN